jgi:hypothetical protein
MDFFQIRTRVNASTSVEGCAFILFRLKIRPAKLIQSNKAGLHSSIKED